MNIHDYHIVWYIVGFLLVPRITLAVLVWLYLPVSLWVKVLASVIAVLGDACSSEKTCQISPKVKEWCR